MKKLICLSLFFSILSAHSQLYKRIDEDLNRRKTGDDKSVLVPVLGALADLVSQDGQTILMQPTLYSLRTLFNPNLTNDESYAKARHARSLQFNLGIITSEETVFEYSGARLGFTYGILNNKTLEKKDYARLASSPEFKILRDIAGALGSYMVANKNNSGGALARILWKQGITLADLPFLPADLRTLLMQATNSATPEELVQKFGAFEKNYESTVKSLEKRTALTFDFNSIRDFDKNEWGTLAITPVNLYTYLFKNKWKSSPALNAKISFGLSKDTISKQPLKRKIWVSELGINFPLIVKNDEPVIEIKPGITHTYVSEALYDKEKKSKFDPVAIFRFRVNKNFYLPLKVVLDTEKDSFFGSLSLQYALQ